MAPRFQRFGVCAGWPWVRRRPAPTGAHRAACRVGPGDYVEIGADRSQEVASPNLEVLLLGGLPIREPVVHYGPFVMNTRDEIIKAMEDYQAGRLGQIPAQAVPHRHPGDVEVPED